MGNKLKIVNVFGIKPTTSYTAAGLDFYIPHLAVLPNDKQELALQEFKKSYGVSNEDLLSIEKYMWLALISKFDDSEKTAALIYDAIHLFLALDTPFTRSSSTSWEDKVYSFINTRLISKNEKIGMLLDFGDHVKINSGIREALPHSYAGVFLNKSGKGTQGYDVRAQVVDEDYTGLVHLSLSYTKDMKMGEIYVGEKLVQQLILPIMLIDECEELDQTEYDEIMKDSERGDNGFDSTQIK